MSRFINWGLMANKTKTMCHIHQNCRNSHNWKNIKGKRVEIWNNDFTKLIETRKITEKEQNEANN